MPKIPLFDCFFDTEDEAALSCRIADKAAKRERCFVVTPNATILHSARHDGDFCRLLSSADITVPDGVGVVWALRLLKTPLPHGKIAGVSLGEAVARELAARGLSLYLFGGREGVAQGAAEALLRRNPALKVAGCRSGFDFSPDRIANEIKTSAPDLVFCCLGSPLQERIGKTLSETLSLPVLCLGGSLDVYAGRVKRAPAVFRALSLEWLWRMLVEPKRFLKIGALFGFSFDVISLKKRKRACNPPKKRI